MAPLYSQPRSRRNAWRWGFAILGAAVLLELVLQLGALVLWWRAPAPTEPERGAGRVVLCIGDSYTFGIGTTDQAHTYPNQLRDRLRSSGGDWQVVAAALPGRNSREVLERIDGQLASFRPDVVCVLVGLNDRWSQPEPLDLAAEPDAAIGTAEAAKFRWRWRTARLVRWAIGKLTEQPVIPDRAWQAEDAVARALRAGDPTTARAEVDALQRELQQMPSAETAEALVVALAALGDGERCLREARAAVRRWPESARLWHQFAWQSYQTGDLDSATDAIERAYGATRSQPLNKRWSILWDRTVIWIDRDPNRALATAIELYLEEGEPANFRGLVGYQPGAFDEQLLDEVLGDLALADSDATRIRELFAGALSWEATDMAKIYESHLRQIVTRCRDAGSQVVLLTYPRALSYVEEATSALAEEMGIARAPVAPTFTRIAPSSRTASCSCPTVTAMTRATPSWPTSSPG